MINAKKTGNKKANADALKEYNGSDIIAFPTAAGVKFYEKNAIVLFRSVSLKPAKRANWEVLLADNTKIKLPNNVTAEKIMNRLSNNSFFLINQSTIINHAYLGEVTFKSNVCLLIKPFDKIEFPVSRFQLTKMRAFFEI